MPVITISRQTGSGGATLGHQVAARLHADYLNTQIIHLVAERLGISAATAAEHNERAEAFGERLTHVLATLDPSLAALSRPVPPLPVESTTTAFVAVTRELVQAAAARGNSVIFGHGAQFILAGQPGILHVRVVAPFPQRVARVMQRTGLAQALAACRAGDILVVWKLDRLGRSLAHLVATVQALAAGGIGLRSLQEQLDTTTAGGKLIFHLFAALAEFERDLIRERTQAGLTAARARGRKGGRPKGVNETKRKAALALKRDPHYSIKEICEIVGISRNTYYKYTRAED